jgi:hypothetical protein
MNRSQASAETAKITTASRRLTERRVEVPESTRSADNSSHHCKLLILLIWLQM